MRTDIRRRRDAALIAEAIGTKPTKAELRRIRRGRALSVQSGQGHGERRYIPVRRTNTRPTYEQRQSQLAKRRTLRRSGLARFF